MRKAKIVDTIGPATESLEGITSLVEAISLEIFSKCL